MMCLRDLSLDSYSLHYIIILLNQFFNVYFYADDTVLYVSEPMLFVCMVFADPLILTARFIINIEMLTNVCMYVLTPTEHIQLHLCWLMPYNPSASIDAHVAVDLEGLALISSKIDGVDA